MTWTSPAGRSYQTPPTRHPLDTTSGDPDDFTAADPPGPPRDITGGPPPDDPPPF